MKKKLESNRMWLIKRPALNNVLTVKILELARNYLKKTRDLFMSIIYIVEGSINILSEDTEDLCQA